MCWGQFWGDRRFTNLSLPLVALLGYVTSAPNLARHSSECQYIKNTVCTIVRPHKQTQAHHANFPFPSLYFTSLKWFPRGGGHDWRLLTCPLFLQPARSSLWLSLPGGNCVRRAASVRTFSRKEEKTQDKAQRWLTTWTTAAAVVVVWEINTCRLNFFSAMKD